MGEGLCSECLEKGCNISANDFSRTSARFIQENLENSSENVLLLLMWLVSKLKLKVDRIFRKFIKNMESII